MPAALSAQPSAPVVTRTDVIYGRVEGSALLANLAYPDGPSLKPAIISVHGGRLARGQSRRRQQHQGDAVGRVRILRDVRSTTASSAARRRPPRISTCAAPSAGSTPTPRKSTGRNRPWHGPRSTTARRARSTSPSTCAARRCSARALHEQEHRRSRWPSAKSSVSTGWCRRPSARWSSSLFWSTRTSRPRDPIERYIHLVSLQDRNETLFYRCCRTHRRDDADRLHASGRRSLSAVQAHLPPAARALHLYEERDEIDADSRKPRRGRRP